MSQFSTVKTPTQANFPRHPLASAEVYRMTTRECERMTAAGVLDDPRVELLDGYVVKKMGKNPLHIWTVDAALEALKAMLPGWWCRKEDPVRLPDFDEPEPDIAVVRGSRDLYRGRIPGPEDIALVVEVSETTVDRDRGPKLTAYARSGIDRHWIINLVSRQIEVYSDPTEGGYSSVQVYTPGQDVPVLVEGAERGRVGAASLLP
ncbi:MAG: Uma2 family endonuclease [Isosphaeraceae bacterium]